MPPWCNGSDEDQWHGVAAQIAFSAGRTAKKAKNVYGPELPSAMLVQGHDQLKSIDNLSPAGAFGCAPAKADSVNEVPNKYRPGCLQMRVPKGIVRKQNTDYASSAVTFGYTDSAHAYVYIGKQSTEYLALMAPSAVRGPPPWTRSPLRTQPFADRHNDQRRAAFVDR